MSSCPANIEASFYEAETTPCSPNSTENAAGPSSAPNFPEIGADVRMVNMSEYFRKTLARMEKSTEIPAAVAAAAPAATPAAVVPPAAKRSRILYQMTMTPVHTEMCVKDVVKQLVEIFYHKHPLEKEGVHDLYMAQVVAVSVSLVSIIQNIQAYIMQLKGTDDREVMKDIVCKIRELHPKLEGQMEHLKGLERDFKLEESDKILIFLPGQPVLFIGTDPYDTRDKLTFRFKKCNHPPPGGREDTYFIEARRYDPYFWINWEYTNALEGCILNKK